MTIDCIGSVRNDLLSQNRIGFMMNLIEIQQETLAQRKMKKLDYFNILQLKNNQLETTKKVVLLLICNLKITCQL